MFQNLRFWSILERSPFIQSESRDLVYGLRSNDREAQRFGLDGLPKTKILHNLALTLFRN